MICWSLPLESVWSAKLIRAQKRLQMIESLKPNVVLLDMKLPDMNGVEIIKKAYKTGNNRVFSGLVPIMTVNSSPSCLTMVLQDIY